MLITINEILRGGDFPPRAIRAIWESVELYEALRTSDEPRLRMEVHWPAKSPYVISPLPRMLSRASANMLFGEEPEITPADESDGDALENVVEGNGLTAELHRAAVVASSEGEVWGRLVVDPSVVDVPIIEFVSRRRVIPHFRGRFLLGATFVTEWATSATERMRLFETYERGQIVSRLYRGTDMRIGTEVELSSFEATRNHQPVVVTGIPEPLVAFIPNSVDADPTRGFSDYAGVENRFFALNEAVTIGSTNMRLAGKKRAFADSKYLDQHGQLPGDDIYVRHSPETTIGEATDPIKVLEYSFEAQQTIAWVEHLIDSTLMFAGLAPQSVGREVEGGAISGTALRLKMVHSLMESAGKGRYFDRGVRQLLRFAALLDARPVAEGGFGRSWADPDGLPGVTRGDGLPRDDVEAAGILATLVGADALSVEERVRFLHPDWDEDAVRDEVQRLRADTPTGAPDEVERPRLRFAPPPAA